MNVSTWDERFVTLAMHISGWSKDRGRRVGCVIADSDRIIRATGYNGFPRGIADGVDERHDRPQKYLWAEHAERNAIFQAAKIGVSLQGCTIYLPWFPCADCARAIVQAGITRLVASQPDTSDPLFGEGFKVATTMLLEARVAIAWHAMKGG